MKLYDCFIFSYELELLDLRLAFLDDTVDYFVIVESKQTLSGLPKNLCFKENEKRYENYKHKIIYLECPAMPGMNAWEYEYFQRNFIKQGLLGCNDNDLILISDVDEIVNIKNVLAAPGLSLPALIELPVYYYFFNLKSQYSFAVNLLAEYDFIKTFNIGCRIPDYSLKIKNIISHHDLSTGWHFSYLFGFKIEKYVEKIKSFSHQEFNTKYFLDENRITNCVKLGIDLFERGDVTFKFETPAVCLRDMIFFVNKLSLSSLIYFPKIRDTYSVSSQWFILRKKTIPSIRLKSLFWMRKIYSSFFRKKITNS